MIRPFSSILFAFALMYAGLGAMAPTASAATFNLFCNKYPPCAVPPNPSSIYLVINLDKSSYTASTNVTMNVMWNSDDFPLNNDVFGASGELPGQSSFTSVSTWTGGPLPTTVLGSVVLGQAPSTAGNYNALVKGNAGSNYSVPAAQNISFSVTVPTTVDVHFQ